MSFEPISLFPGMLLESATRWAHDQASRYPERPTPDVIREMGWNAVLVPEALGGVGGSVADLGSIIEGLASHAVDIPVITRCGVIPALLSALLATQSKDLASGLLTGIAEGSAVVELGSPLDDHDSQQALIARRSADEWLLSGATASLALSDDCTHVLLIAQEEDTDTPLILMVDSNRLHPHAETFLTMDDQVVSQCRLDALRVPADSLVASGQQAQEAILAGQHLATVAVAADIASTMGSTLASTITYLKERQQFGQPLAQFQALRHDVAQLYITYELVRNLLNASMATLDGAVTDERTRASIDLLGLYISEAAIQFAESVIQLHGGMGMTREMPAARQATRLLANAFRHGDALGHTRKLDVFRIGASS